MSMNKVIFYVLESLVVLFIFLCSIRQARRKHHSIYSRQMCYVRFLILSLALYYLCGFFGGIFIFRASPLSSIFRVAALMDIPLYALCFLVLCIFYGFLIVVTTIKAKIKKETPVEASSEEEEVPHGFLGHLVHFGNAHPGFSWFCCYTLLFIFLCFCIFSVNILKGRGLIWRIDGKSQYFPYMSYMSDYFKEMFENFRNGNFSFRMYDFTIGMGEDIRSVVRIHPTEFLSVFVKKEHLEILYNFLMFFRYYLAGLSFYIYCRHKQIERMGILIGSYAYIFSGYGLSLASFHPIFNAPVILLPLILLGLDRVIERKGYLLFTLMTAIFMSLNYYFLYITTIAMAFYGILHFFEVYDTHRIKEFFAMVGRIIWFYVLGIGMSAMFFLPTVIRALTSERVGTTRTVYNDMFSYARDQYIRIFVSTITGKYHSSEIHMSFVILFLPALVVLFLGPIRKHIKLKILIILQFIAVMLPVCGLVMSAFSTINNRWIFIFAFTGAYTIALTAKDFKKLHILQQLGLIGITVLYYFAYKTRVAVNTEHIFDVKTSLVFLGVTVLVLLFISFVGNLTSTQVTAFLLILSTVSLTMHGVYLFGNNLEPQTKTFVSNGEMDKYLANDEFSRLSTIKDDSFYRSDIATMRDHYENTPLFFGYNGTSIYNSVINSNLINYHTELGSIGLGAVHRVYSFDGRSALESLASVKYYETKANRAMSVPYGFEKREDLSDNLFWIYENKNPLPIGYTYTNTLSRDTYEKLSSLEKQQVMMKVAVVDEEKSGLSNVSSSVPFDAVEEKPVKITGVSALMNQEGNSLKTDKKKHLEVHLETLEEPKEKDSDSPLSYKPLFQNASTLQLFLRNAAILSSADFTDIQEFQNQYIHGKLKDDKKANTFGLKKASDEKLPGFTVTMQKKKGYEVYLKLSNVVVSKSRVPFKIRKEYVSKQFIVRSPMNTYAFDLDNYYINLGYCEEDGETTFDFKFTLRGDYSIDEMKLCYVPVNGYDKDIANLKKDSLENVVIDENTVSGTVTASENEVMVFSIPYSSGWTATVDGKKANLFRANTAYMGVALDKGEHSILLSYETPGLRIGMIVSGISTLIFLVFLIALGILKLEDNPHRKGRRYRIK